MARVPVLIVLLALIGCERQQPQPPPAATTTTTATTITIAVGGMHCRGCAMAITEAVGNLGGVSRCEVSLENESAEIEIDPKQVTPAEVASVIAGLGYHAAMPGEESIGEADAGGGTDEAPAEPAPEPVDEQPVSP